MRRIIWDTETTGFPPKGNLPNPDDWPYVIEFGGIVTDEDFHVLDEFSTLIRPINTKGRTVAIPPAASKSNKIYDKDVANADPFPAHFMKLAELFLGCNQSIAHNHLFDKRMLTFDLRRINKVTFFPWPPLQLCTVQATKHLNKGKYIKLEKLYEYLYQEERPTATPV